MAYKTPNMTSEYIRSIMNKERDSCLCDLMQQADNLNIPILLPEAAIFLKQLLILKKPLKVLEIGTAIGYSGLIFLKNCNCFFTTVEKNKSFAELAKNNFDKEGFSGRYEIINDDAGEAINNLNERYDFIFLDGPKAQYINYLERLSNLLVDGGLLLADNVLFNGMVAKEIDTPASKKSIVKNLDLFLKALYADSRFVTSVLNVGDGMSLSIKND